MPSLDVTEILADADIADNFDVVRRTQTVSNTGRTAIATQTFAAVAGVVCSASPNDLEVLEDAQRMGRHLSVVTTFRLRGPSRSGGVDSLPDLLTWEGNQYVVKHIDPYQNYGAGFVQAIVGSIDTIDTPPV